MKKILLTVMAVAAIGFTSCGNKAQQTEAAAETVDSVAIVQAAADEAAEASISELKTQIEAGDASKLQIALEAVKTKIAELVKSNPEVAKEYVAKVQNFLKENADKVKAIVGDNAAVAAAVSAITEVEPANVVNGLLQSVGDAAANAKDSVASAVNEKVDEAKQAAEDKANELKDAAKQKAGEAVDNAANGAKKALGL